MATLLISVQHIHFLLPRIRNRETSSKIMNPGGNVAISLQLCPLMTNCLSALDGESVHLYTVKKSISVYSLKR